MWYVWHCLFQRLIVCLEESLYIHNIRDMKVLHTIRDTPPNPHGLCALSINNDNCYLAYPGSNQIGEVQIFDTINLVGLLITFTKVEWVEEIANLNKIMCKWMLFILFLLHPSMYHKHFHFMTYPSKTMEHTNCNQIWEWCSLHESLPN